MINKKETAGKVMTAFYRSCLGKKPTFQDDKIAVAAALRELVNQCSTALPPDSNMDEFYARMYGSSESVVYADGILREYRDWETDRKSTRLNSSHRL